MTTAWLTTDAAHGNLTLLPAGDLAEHTTTEHCLCLPRWVPHHHGYGPMQWVFVHRAWDRRAVPSLALVLGCDD